MATSPTLQRFRQLSTARLTASCLFLALVLVLGACGGTEDTPAPTLPEASCTTCNNVVLISIDTLRADRMSLYGHERATTPHLESLAASAVTFDRFYYTGGGTLESHMSMLTGLYPHTHRVNPDNGHALQEERITLTEVLASASYSTAAFVDAGYLRHEYGFDQGFDVYNDQGGHFAKILPRAQGWLEEQQNSADPFFLFLHTYDVHSQYNRLPYECPGDYPWTWAVQPATWDGCRDDRCSSELLAWTNRQIDAGRLEPGYFSDEEVQFMRDLYDGCIRYVDARLADLFGLLKSMELWEDTLVIVTSDHGEEFFEHGKLLHVQGGFEEMAHIPLVVKFPGEAHGGLRVTSLAAMVDLVPTILEVVGLPVPEAVQGRSLLPSVEAGQSVRDGVHMYSVFTDGRWKLLRNQTLLFDLESDPAEQNNLWSVHGERRDALQSRLEDRLRVDRRAYKLFTDQYGLRLREGLNREERQELEALGYL